MFQFAVIGSGLLLFRISDAVFGSVESPASFVDVRFFFRRARFRFILL